MHRAVILSLVACLTSAVSFGAQGKTQKISKNLANKATDTVKEIEKVTKQLDKTVEQQSSPTSSWI